MTQRAARSLSLATRLSVSAVVVAMTCAVPAQAAETTDDPDALEGVPDRIVGRIIDITTLRVERPFYTSPDTASIATHVIHQPKEMPGHHAYVRPHQRRVFGVPRMGASPNAVAEVEPNSSGSLRYAARIGGSGSSGHGSLRATGLSANDDFTQGRGSRAETALTLAGGLRGLGARGDLAASWSRLSLNRRAPNASLIAFDRATVKVRGTGSFGPPRRRIRTRLSVGATDHQVGPPAGGGEDRITQASASLETDLRAEARPLTLSLRAMGRRVESATSPSSTDTALARAGIADRYALAFGGAVDWRAGLAVYSQPDGPAGEAGEATFIAPIEVGWTTEAGPTGMRIHGGYDVAQPPIALYTETGHVAVNPALPARTSWGGGASLWVRVGSALLTARVDAEDVKGLPVWVETDVGPHGAIAWKPEAVDARLVSWRAGVAAPRGAHTTFSVEIAGETAERADDPSARLPYRPSMTARVQVAFDAPGDITVRLSADHVGERYPAAVAPDPLGAHTLFGARVTKSLTPALRLFVSGQAAAGTYQAFESRHGSELHGLPQGGVGVGLTGRI